MLAGAATAYSQGTISLLDYGASGFGIVVFAPQASGPVAVTFGGYIANEVQGNPTLAASGGLEVNAGTTAYTGAVLSGTGYEAQLYAGPAGSTYASGLTAYGTPVNFYASGSGFAGMWLAPAVNPVAIGTVAAGSPAAVAMAAWADTGSKGAANTLAAAQADGYAWGMSAIGTSGNLGGPPPAGTPPYLPASLTSFSLGSSVPEPSTIALGVIGASAFLMRLRRKS